MNYLRLVLITMVTLSAGCAEIQVNEQDQGPADYGYIDLQIYTNVSALIYSGKDSAETSKLVGPAPMRVKVYRQRGDDTTEPILRIVQEGLQTKRISRIPYQYKSYPSENESKRNPSRLNVELNSSKTMYQALRVYSNPPGADVYTWNGEHAGNTQDGSVLVMGSGKKPWEELFGGDKPWLNPSADMQITLKKDEFDDAQSTFRMKYLYDSSVQAQMYPDTKSVELYNKKIWASIKIASDLRAQVYSTNGIYWGESGPDDYLYRVFWLDQSSSNSQQYTIVLKKSGCKQTRYEFTLNYKYKTRVETESNYDTVFVVLGPCV